LAMISLPDFWGKRMQQFGVWYQALDNKEKA
jgi:hypothetical protein